MTALDTIVFRGSGTAIGRFACPVHHPAFRDSGPIAEAIVVFPRTSVWIRHAGSAPFVADPSVVTMYNRGQVYERGALSPEGDRCDWFAMTDDLAREIVGAFDPAARDADSRPFRLERAQSSPSLYLQQRQLTRRAARGTADALEIEEEVTDVVTQVLAQAFARPPEPPEGRQAAGRRVAERRRRDLVERTKAELLQSISQNRSASEIANSVGSSVFHLCRVFRTRTGQTMHGYRTQLRIRLLLERIGDADSGKTLSELAQDLGFASHAHLVHACRRVLGAPPGAIRDQLRGAQQARSRIGAASSSL